MGTRIKVLATLVLAAVLALATTGLAASARTELVSVSSSDEPGNSSSFSSAVSADGRYVAFDSLASNLVTGDTNRDLDVFVRDRALGTTERVSVSSTGQQGNHASFEPAISADGRYVAFASDASNLVTGDANRDRDVFVRDLRRDTTERVSIPTRGGEGNEDSSEPAISADGRYVAFVSDASNLVRGDTGRADVFVRDRKLDITRRVSVSATGREDRHHPPYAPSISANGRYVAFGSGASNLVAGDNNGESDVFVRDRKRHKTTRVSVSSSGHQGDGPSGFPRPGLAISANGRYVAFASAASNLVPRDTRVVDVFVRDRKRHKTRRVSVSSHGHPGNRRSAGPAISANGRYVAFGSRASNLVPGDTNGQNDVFVRDRKRDKTRRVSIFSTGQNRTGDSNLPAISADGRFVAFASETGATKDIFVRGPLH
jgi:Tol biopolymer transport system component